MEIALLGIGEAVSRGFGEVVSRGFDGGVS
jgi:hypothetical protein